MWRLIIPLVPPDFLWFQNLVPYPKQVQHFVSCAAPNAQEPVYKDQPSRHETITRPFAAVYQPYQRASSNAESNWGSPTWC